MGIWEEAKKANAAAAEAQAKIVCQFCHEAGHVTFRQVKRKKRPTFTRVLGATVTLGATLPITGVSSKKGMVTEMRCGNCRMQWDV